MRKGEKENSRKEEYRWIEGTVKEKRWRRRKGWRHEEEGRR